MKLSSRIITFSLILLSLILIIIILFSNRVNYGVEHYDEIRYYLINYELEHIYNYESDYITVRKDIDKLPCSIFILPDEKDYRYIYTRTKNNKQLYLKYNTNSKEILSLTSDKFMDLVNTNSTKSNLVYDQNPNS